MPIDIQANRGQTITLTMEFYDDPSTKTTPLTPVNPSQYPSVAIRDINGLVVFTGIGKQMVPGLWRFDFFVPVDAPLTNDTSTWSAQWIMLTSSGRQREEIQE